MSEKDASPTLTATDYSRDFQMVNLNFAGDVNMRPPSEHFNELPEEISKVINANESPGERFTPPEPYCRQIDNPSEADNKKGWSPVVPKKATQEKFYISTKGQDRPLFYVVPTVSIPGTASKKRVTQRTHWQSPF